MQNKIRISKAASLLALAATAGAAQAAPPGVYLGADLVAMKTRVDDQTGLPPIVTGSANATTLRLRGGAHVLDWLDLEAHYVLPQEKAYSNTLGDNTVRTTVLGIYAKPNIDLGPFNLYALAGLASAKIEMAGAIVGSQTASGFSYGAGVQYPITKNLALSVDYMHYFKKSLPVLFTPQGLDVEGNAFGIGLNYTFR